MSARRRILVIGGGIVGLATGRQLLRDCPDLSLCVLEKEAGPGQHQSGHNSGVLHAGLYYAPGSAKARLAVSGIRQMISYCREKRIPHELCGKLVIATDPSELAGLKRLLDRGRANGLSGLQWLGPEQIRDIEPHAFGLAALRVPEEGIVDYAAVVTHLAADITASGGRLACSAKVTDICRVQQGWRVTTAREVFEADVLVNCAGLHSDRIHARCGGVDRTRIVPFRGEYYLLRPERQSLVRHLIYPVPDPSLPFLGVHFTRRIQGGVEAGPNAALAFAREGYSKRDFSLRDIGDALTYSGFWRFLLRYPSACWDEFRKSFSKELFLASLRRLVPELALNDLQPGGAGVRAQALTPNGRLVEDFHFVRQRGALHVINAPSPAATASLAIAKEVATMVKDVMEA